LWAQRLEYCSSGSARQGEDFVRVHLDGRATADLRKTVSRVFRTNQLRARYSQRDLTVLHWFEADGCAWPDAQESADGLWNCYPPAGGHDRGPIWPESIHRARS
jgi:hypothetical protein